MHRVWLQATSWEGFIFCKTKMQFFCHKVLNIRLARVEISCNYRSHSLNSSHHTHEDGRTKMYTTRHPTIMNKIINNHRQDNHWISVNLSLSLSLSLSLTHTHTHTHTHTLSLSLSLLHTHTHTHTHTLASSLWQKKEKSYWTPAPPHPRTTN